MFRIYLKNSIIYNVSNILTKGISFFLLPLYTSILTKRDYGNLEMFSLFSTFIIIFFSFQINQGVARYYNELKNQRHRQIYTSTVIYFSLASFLFFVVVAFLIEDLVLKSVELPKIDYRLMIISIFCNSLFYLFQNQLTWKLLPFFEMLSSLLYNITTIALTLVFILKLDMRISGIFLAQSIGALVGIVGAFIFTYKDFALVFSVKVLKKILKFSLPLLPGALSVFVFIFTDRICIKELLDVDNLGVFSVGNKIASILTFVLLPFTLSLSPLIYKYFKESDTPRKISVIFKNYLFLAFVTMSGISIFSFYFVKLLANTSYLAAVGIIPLMLFSIFLNSLSIFFPGLSISKKGFKISLINIFGGVINLVLNLVLIPLIGILGAVVSTAIAYLLTFVIYYNVSQKEYKIPVSIEKFALVLILYALISYLSTFFLTNFFILSLIYFFSIVTVILILYKKSEALAFLNFFRK